MLEILYTIGAHGVLRLGVGVRWIPALARNTRKIPLRPPQGNEIKGGGGAWRGGWPRVESAGNKCGLLFRHSHGQRWSLESEAPYLPMGAEFAESESKNSGWMFHTGSIDLSNGEKKIRYWRDAATSNRMSVNNKKQFGVWMDTHHATIIGHADATTEEFSVLGHASNPGASGNSNEHAKQNQQRTLQNQFFKEIANKMQNADEVHVTGTGTVQEQFIHFLAETPQFKNTVTRECTSNKMSDERLVEFISGKFN